ncbi:hypothetical protein [Streptomyces sp. NBC_01481]|uniref:hypothetical protein n=1 Tax=Streptomyces sp. NBC_01481 TaxID=2975869 RepID=UPI002258CACF|nr:hypothetical protein [Streptomyces sp. NBC_01481]MCX4586539.1 hypothetical protein [Streptomyces sp. NBC_01481]
MIDPASINLPQFLANWHGPANVPPGTLPAECDWLPESLKEWHSLSAQWSTPLMGMKRMLAPEEVKAEDGKAVFMEDATGDWRWAFDTENPNITYDAEVYEEWERTTESLPQLIVHSAVQEAVFRARAQYWCTQLEEQLLGDVLAPLEEVAFGDWRWPAPGYRIFMSENVVADVVPTRGRTTQEDRAGFVQVQAASPDPRHLSYLDEIPGAQWRKSTS